MSIDSIIGMLEAKKALGHTHIDVKPTVSVISSYERKTNNTRHVRN